MGKGINMGSRNRGKTTEIKYEGKKVRIGGEERGFVNNEKCSIARADQEMRRNTNSVRRA
jgi:hypothetical protein